MRRVRLDDPRYYFNRHRSWLAFNRRVLYQALDDSNPLLERVKFLAITASNLDEFVEVRLSGLLQQVEHGANEISIDGLLPQQQLDLLSRDIHEFVAEQYNCWRDELLPALAREGIRVRAVATLDSAVRDAVDLFYTRRVDPLLTPVTIDPAHPFPRVINKSLCIAFQLQRRRRPNSEYLGVVTVPRKLPRLVRIPNSKDTIDYVFLHDLVETHARNLYHGYDVLSSGAFRATRNSNLYLHEEESKSLLESVDSQLHNRRKGDVVRLEIESQASPSLQEPLRERFGLRPWQIFRVNGPVNLSRLFFLAEQAPRPDLRFPSFVGRTMSFSSHDALFERVRDKDILLHHPYDSYGTVVSFLEGAARDPNVLSIKQTLYRTSENSPVVRALIEAAQNKEVTVVVELKASFDEASNIQWARSLEEAGVHVSHGLVGLKTHCKMALVVRNDADGEIRRYVHLGTGNYNPVTANFYTDLSLLTADDSIASAVHELFNFLTARAEPRSYAPLFVAPHDLSRKCLELIEREIFFARRKQPARIIAKMNALIDPKIIQGLYRAARGGVAIDLIVRGGCALRPGIKGLSEHIKVRSIVGRFLEHSRIFYFENGGNPEIYLGSADWMPRNLYERVELMFPINGAGLKKRIYDEILVNYLKDNAKSCELRADGWSAPRVNNDQQPLFNAQEFLLGLVDLAPETKFFSAVANAPDGEHASDPRMLAG